MAKRNWIDHGSVPGWTDYVVTAVERVLGTPVGVLKSWYKKAVSKPDACGRRSLVVKLRTRNASFELRAQESPNQEMVDGTEIRLVSADEVSVYFSDGEAGLRWHEAFSLGAHLRPEQCQISSGSGFDRSFVFSLDEDQMSSLLERERPA